MQEQKEKEIVIICILAAWNPVTVVRMTSPSWPSIIASWSLHAQGRVRLPWSSQRPPFVRRSQSDRWHRRFQNLRFQYGRSAGGTSACRRTQLDHRTNVIIVTMPLIWQAFPPPWLARSPRRARKMECLPP